MLSKCKESKECKECVVTSQSLFWSTSRCSGYYHISSTATDTSPRSLFELLIRTGSWGFFPL